MSIFEKLFNWLDDNSPVFCNSCNKIIRRKNAVTRYTTMGVTASLCQECDAFLFAPFSRSESNNARSQTPE